jgi:hypothetical protein
MKILQLTIIISILSCSPRSDKSGKTFDNKKTINVSDKEPNSKKYNPEYPLVKFYYDKNTVDENKKGMNFPEEINDLVIDTSNNNLIVSFDRDGRIGCPFEGYIDMSNKDIVYLEYLENCIDIDDIVTESKELRFYYQFTDALSYKWRKFIPRQKRQPK